jgi:competence protein ComEC
MSNATPSASIWRKAPFVRLLLFLIAGIVWGLYGPSTPLNAWLWAGALVLAALITAHGRLRAYGIRWVFGLLVALALAILGSWRVSTLADGAQANHFSTLIPADSLAYFAGKVVDRQLSNDRLRLRIAVDEAGLQAEAIQPVDGRLLMYVPLDRLSDTLFPGSRLAWRGKVQRLTPPLNPKAFDFSAYQARQNCFYQTRIDSADWQLLHRPAFSLQGLALRARHRMLIYFRRYIPGSNELGVATALVLGSRDDMQDTVQKAYSQTGAVHVLSVSGLHVGIVAVGLRWLLAFLPLPALGRRWILLALSWVGVWAFALLTGLSPSVQRSAVMFSLLLFGQALDRPHQMYNTLAASAFLLLLHNPWLLLDVGFQLSYLAVAGILLFHGPIYRAIYLRPRWADYCWNLTAVGIAAQLTTFPLSMYYFHQFPVYFWLSGLLVVPVSPFILGLGILLAALGSIPALGMLTGSLLYGLIWLMNAGIFGLSQLPGAVIDQLWIGGATLALLYGAVAALSGWLESRQPAWALSGLALLAAGLAFTAYTSWQRYRQEAMVVYHSPRATVVDWFEGKQRYTWATLPEQAPAVQWAAGNNRSYRGARPIISLQRVDTSAHAGNWAYRRGVARLGSHSTVLLDALPEAPPPPEPLTVDVVVLRGNPRLRIEDCGAYFRADRWVFDGSNSRYRVNAWLDECIALGWQGHATAFSGAYVREWR